MLEVYVGYDAREDVAWRVARHSLLRHTTSNIRVHPLKQETLRARGMYRRAPDEGATTAFSLTRFLTPSISGETSWSLFCDCDFLFTADICALLRDLDDDKAVYVVQHDYVPTRRTKMDGRVQTIYPRKNWSSFMLFNGRHPAIRALTPEVVNTHTPKYLHQLQWVEDDAIGALPPDWNFLVGEYPTPPTVPRGIHFTNGGPWFANCRTVDYADLWERELACLDQLTRTDRDSLATD